jgi:hypothetical protein
LGLAALPRGGLFFDDEMDPSPAAEPLMVLECEATFAGRRTPPAKILSAQDGEAVGLVSSGQNWNSAAEEVLLLLASPEIAGIASSGGATLEPIEGREKSVGSTSGKI